MVWPLFRMRHKKIVNAAVATFRVQKIAKIEGVAYLEGRLKSNTYFISVTICTNAFSGRLLCPLLKIIWPGLVLVNGANGMFQCVRFQLALCLSPLLPNIQTHYCIPRCARAHRGIMKANKLLATLTVQIECNIVWWNQYTNTTITDVNSLSQATVASPQTSQQSFH